MNQKHMALFLAALMVMSVFSFFLSSLLGDSSNGVENTDVADAPGFDTIPGTHVNAQLNSLEDGLKVTPSGATTVFYMDYLKAYGTPIQILGPNITELSSFYGSNVVQIYMAQSKNTGFEVQAHTLVPEVVNFKYDFTEKPYNGYYLLKRDEGIYNVIGSPMLLGGRDSLESVIDVSSGNTPASSDFDKILSYTEPGAQYQIVTSEDPMAVQHYIEFRSIEDGNYARTEVFLEPADSLLESIGSLQTNSTERGLTYEFNVYEEDDVAIVEITANESNFYNLAIEQFK
ncbi:hypothetical protein V7O66_06030 [Methanolobus sp. ZRKC3]|uniref:hypothetical protein n=1 Tax=Methanolobus sp. ZRKC3 TaxID=3125786 RepID=UPI0032435CA6